MLDMTTDMSGLMNFASQINIDIERCCRALVMLFRVSLDAFSLTLGAFWFAWKSHKTIPRNALHNYLV